MLVRVDAPIRIAADETPANLVERLRWDLSFPKPAFLDRLRLGLPPAGQPENLSFLDEDDAEIRLPRGAPDKGRAVLVDFVDRKVPTLRRKHPERRRLHAEALGFPVSRLRTSHAKASTTNATP
jgi:hypothetical protein